MRPIGVLYEHPEWFRPLFAELDRRGLPYEPLDATALTFDPSEPEPRYSLLVNRTSPSAWARGHESAIFHTLHYLAYLDRIGARVLNGLGAYELELSKARQIALLAQLGIAHPRTRIVPAGADLAAAADGLRFPVLMKPNIGGSGAGIASFATPAELAAAHIEPGLDRTLLVQEQLVAEGDAVVRIELLEGEYLYAIRLLLLPGSFNLCPADYCDLPGVADGVSGRGLPIEAYTPPPEAVEDARRIAAAAGLDVCGVEYLVDGETGEPTFFDVNALSNFVADAPDVIGFDPFVELVDVLERRATASVPAAA